MIMALAMLLSSCGDTSDSRAAAAGSVTADDARQLNEAAEMLDVSNHPPLPDNSLTQ